jgi:hypothetical protein
VTSRKQGGTASDASVLGFANSATSAVVGPIVVATVDLE